MTGELLQRAASYVQGAVIVTGYHPAARTRKNQRFVKEFLTLNGHEPDIFSAYLYNAAKLARRLLNAGGREGVRDALANQRGSWLGLSGAVVTTPGGNLESPLVWFEVAGKAFQPKSNGMEE